MSSRMSDQDIVDFLTQLNAADPPRQSAVPCLHEAKKHFNVVESRWVPPPPPPPPLSLVEIVRRLTQIFRRVL
jgi:hypothetical protein